MLLQAYNLVERDEEMWPTSAVALTVTNINLMSDDYFAILAPEFRGCRVTCRPRKQGTKDAIPFPSKIFVSGHNWTMVIQYDVKVMEKAMAVMNNSIPMNIINWFRHLPSVVSSSIAEPIILEQWSKAKSQPFLFKAIVDSSCLAALAGLRVAQNITEHSFTTTRSLCHPFMMLICSITP